MAWSPGAGEDAVTRLINSTVSGNTAHWSGGVRIVYGSAELTDCTVANNKGDESGGVRYRQLLWMKDFGQAATSWDLTPSMN
jgi:hypothetical protein